MEIELFKELFEKALQVGPNKEIVYGFLVALLLAYNVMVTRKADKLQKMVRDILVSDIKAEHNTGALLEKIFTAIRELKDEIANHGKH